MTTQVIRTGGTVRVVVTPRGIADAEIIDGDLVFDYTDGTQDNVGNVLAGSVIPDGLVGRETGDYLISRETGDILIGVS